MMIVVAIEVYQNGVKRSVVERAIRWFLNDDVGRRGCELAPNPAVTKPCPAAVRPTVAIRHAPSGSRSIQTTMGRHTQCRRAQRDQRHDDRLDRHRRAPFARLTGGADASAGGEGSWRLSVDAFRRCAPTSRSSISTRAGALSSWAESSMIGKLSRILRHDCRGRINVSCEVVSVTRTDHASRRRLFKARRASARSGDREQTTSPPWRRKSPSRSTAAQTPPR